MSDISERLHAFRFPRGEGSRYPLHSNDAIKQAEGLLTEAAAALVAAEARAAAAEEALAEAVAEIEGLPYADEPWGFGIAYRLPDWRYLLASAGAQQEADFRRRHPERPPYADPAWLPWLAAHPDHHFYGLMIAHPLGCDRSCLSDAPVLAADRPGGGPARDTT